MKALYKHQEELLKAITEDEELNRWLYYSIAYNSTLEQKARDFVSKLNLNNRHPINDATRVSDIKAIIPNFIETY